MSLHLVVGAQYEMTFTPRSSELVRVTYLGEEPHSTFGVVHRFQQSNVDDCLLYAMRHLERRAERGEFRAVDSAEAKTRKLQSGDFAIFERDGVREFVRAQFCPEGSKWVECDFADGERRSVLRSALVSVPPLEFMESEETVLERTRLADASDRWATRGDGADTRQAVVQRAVDTPAPAPSAAAAVAEPPCNCDSKRLASYGCYDTCEYKQWRASRAGGAK